MLTVATYGLTMDIEAVTLQDQGGGLQLVALWARKLNPAERGNTYYVYDLEPLAVCEAVKHWSCHPGGCSNFLAVTYHDTLRHRRKHPNNKLNKLQARYLRDLQPFVGSMTLAYRKEAVNEAYPLSWLNSMTVNALRLSHEFANLISEGYSQDSFYGDEGEWTKDIRIGARACYFWSLDRICIPRNIELRLRLISKFRDNASARHKGVARTLTKALDIFLWRRIRQDAKYFL
jgi:hypothetical protein